MKEIKEKKYIHHGVPIIVFMILMYLCIMAFLLINRVNESLYICLFITASLLFGLLCVYNITITIDNTYLSFKLGIGLIKKRYRITNIKSCKSYSGISKRIGIGTKMSCTGDKLNYYIVTGSKTIELKFHDNKTIVHI